MTTASGHLSAHVNSNFRAIVSAVSLAIVAAISFLAFMAIVLNARAASLPTVPTIDKQSALEVRGDVERSLWVWSSEDIVYSVGTAKQEFFNFCENPKGIDDPAAPAFAHRQINHVFLASRGFITSGPEEMDSLRAFLREAHTRGIRVDYLDGEATWVNKTAGEANQAMNSMLSFNKQGLPEERFDGVLLDVQPYTLRGWYTPTLWNQYTAFLRSMKAKVHMADKNLPFGVSIPRWYDVTLGSAALAEVYANVNYVAVLDYVDQEKTLIESIAGEIELADSMNVKVYAGVETASNVIPSVTFQSGGWLTMEHALSSLHTSYMFDKSFAGVAISNYSSYRGMRRASHSIDQAATNDAQIGTSVAELSKANCDVVVLDRVLDHMAGLQKKDVQRIQNSNGHSRTVLAGVPISTFIRFATQAGAPAVDALHWTLLAQNGPTAEMKTMMTKVLALGFDGVAIDIAPAVALARKLNDPSLERAIVSTIQSLGTVSRTFLKRTNAIIVVRGGEDMLPNLDAESYSAFATAVDGIVPTPSAALPTGALVSTVAPEKASVLAALAQISRSGVKVFGNYDFTSVNRLAQLKATRPSTFAAEFENR